MKVNRWKRGNASEDHRRIFGLELRKKGKKGTERGKK